MQIQIQIRQTSYTNKYIKQRKQKYKQSPQLEQQKQNKKLQTRMKTASEQRIQRHINTLHSYATNAN